MKCYSLTHLSNEALRRELTTAAARERGATAELIAHIAEFDARKLYLPAGFESMFAYCTGELGLSEDAAAKRIQVARAAKRFPVLFDALADGRIHLTGLRLLAPHLAPETVDDLLAAATRQSKGEIERILAGHFPQPELAEQVAPIPARLSGGEHAPGHVDGPALPTSCDGQGAPGHPLARIAPLSAKTFAVQFTRNREADERFRYLQDLLGHAVSRGDIAEVYDRAVMELIAKLERVRFGGCERPRSRPARTRASSRRIPAHVKRAVWQRDGGQCTFVGETGHRCEARGEVEFDHVTEVARGGEPTIEGLRLRCRGHNQYTAERTFGAGFMQAKREEARAAAAQRRAERERPSDAAKSAAAQRKAERQKEADESRLRPHELEVIPWLRQLGCREDESRIAARRCRDMAEASLEERVKRALSWFGARCGHTVRPALAAG